MNRLHSVTTGLLMVSLFVLFTQNAPLFAQGVAQVNLTGIPPILENPSVSSQIDRYDQRQFGMQFIYSTPGAFEMPFRFRFLIEHNGNTVVDVTSEPRLYRPGVYRYESFSDFPEIEFSTTLSDVISQLNASQGGLTNQTGNLAEGAYTIMVEPEPLDQAAFVTTIPAFAMFSVYYADPPVLISPADQSIISPNFPLFSWTATGGLPSGSLVEYQLTIVELFEGQSPGVAITSNLPVLDQVMSNPLFIYGADQLPLEPGKTYAWQVRTTESVYNIPFTQNGLTEIYTFQVMSDDGYYTDRFDWSYPFANPFAEVRIDDARIGPLNVVIDGRYSGRIDNVNSLFIFEDLVLSPDGRTIDGGRVSVDQGTGFEALISSDNSLTPFTTGVSVPGGSDPSVWIMPDFMQITSDGVIPSGIGSATLFYEGVTFEELNAAFAQDLLISQDMRIIRGQVVLSDSGLDLAVLDASGFRFITEQEDDLLARMPDYVALPDHRFAYLKLRDNGRPLVTPERHTSGGILLRPIEGETQEIVLPVFTGNPVFPVSIESVILDPAMGRVASGIISHVVTDDAAASLLTDNGIPVELQMIRFSPGQNLQFTGLLTLFEHVFEQNGEIVLRLDHTGRLSSAVNIHDAELKLPLVGNDDRVALVINSISGTLDFELLSANVPYFSMDIGSDFVITGSDGETTSAELFSSFNSMGEFYTEMIQGFEEDSPAILQLDRVRFAIDQINHLKLSYTESGGFQFNAMISTSIGIQADETLFTIPLKNVELRNSGFLIPEQNIHYGMPDFVFPSLQLGPLEMHLIAMRLPGLEFNWFGWNVGLPSGINPAFDFEVHFPGFNANASELASASVTLQNAGLDEGFITGSLQTYFFQRGAYVPFSGTAGILVQEISGSLYRDGNSQGFDINMLAKLHAPDIFAKEASGCDPPEFTLSLTENSRFSGRIENINLCKQFDLDIAILSLGDGFLDFNVSDGQQSVIAGGMVNAALTKSWFQGAEGRGNVELNVLTGELIDIAAELNDITWSFPSNSPLFSFGIERVVLDREGMVVDGAGSLRLSDQSVDVSYDGLVLDYSNGLIKQGELEIEGYFGFEVDVSPFTWSVTGKRELLPEDQNKALLVLEPGLRISRDGIAISGETAAFARVSNVIDASIKAEFIDLSLGFSPFGIQSGQIDLVHNESRFGYIDKGGFTFDDLLAAVDLPEQLPLPRLEVAYLVLTEGDQNLVELGSLNEDGSTRSMRTRDGETVKLVIAGLGQPGDHPELDIAFDLTVNANSFEIVSGIIDVGLENNPYGLSRYGFPLDLTRIRYSMEGGNFELMAGTRLKLPESLPNVSVNIESMLTFSETGFESFNVEDGVFSTTRVQGTEDLIPLISVDFPEELIGLDLYGLHLNIGGNQNAFKISGDLRSKFIRDSQGEGAPIHFSAAYEENENRWLFTADISHLPGNKIPIYKAYFEQYPNSPFMVEVTDEDFFITLAGKISIPEFSDNFALSIDELHIGSDKIEIKAHTETNQELELFGDFLTLTIRDPGIEYSSDSDVFYFILNGDLVTNIQKAQSGQTQQATSFSFDGLRAGTDGSFELASADLNLLGEQRLSLLPDVFWIDRLNIGYENINNEDLFVLSAVGSVKIPVPGKTNPGSGSDVNAHTSNFSFAIDSKGNMVENPVLEFIFDEKEWPTISGNQLTEFSLGSFATLQVTGVMIDFDVMQPAATKLYGAFAVHVHQSGTSRDNSGRMRVIRFGRAGDLVNSYGISYSFTEGLDFHVDLAGTPDNPLFSFETAFFEVGLVYVKMEDSKLFDIEIGGHAELMISAVSGSMGYEGFRFGSEGIIDYGRPTGSFSVSVVDVVSLSVGGFAFEQQIEGGSPVQMQVLTQEENGEGDPIITTAYMEVRRYLSLTDVSITLGSGAFEGAVESVLYYEDTGGTTVFSIQNAVLALGDAGKLWANLMLESGPAGFALEVAGVASIKQFGLGAYGAIRMRDSDLSFGIFVAGTGMNLDLFPIIPNTIILKGGGAGFFYRPEMNDFKTVETLLNQLTGSFAYNNPNGLPESNNLLFAVMVYGELGIIGSVATGFAIDGNAMLILTDSFANLDINATLLRQNGTPGTLRAGMYLTAGWMNNFMLQGGVRVDILYPVVDGNARVDFFLQGEPQTSNLVWGLNGNLELTLINFAKMNGNFMVNRSGMLVNIFGRISFDVTIISVESNAVLSFWYYASSSNLGLYTSFNIHAEVAGGLAKAGVFVEGALISEGANFLLFAQGGGYVSIPYVYTGSVNAWVSVRKSGSGTSFNGGLGRKKQYENLIESSKRHSDNFNLEAIALRISILDAKIADVTLSEAQLQQAGINLRSLSPSERNQFADRMLALESRTYQINVPQLGTRNITPITWSHFGNVYEQLADVIVRAPNQPERPGDIPSGDDVNIALGSLNEGFDDISDRLAKLEIEYDPELPAESQELIIQIPITQSGPFEFEIDETMADELVNSYQNSFEELDALGEKYRQMLADNQQLVSAYIDGMQEVNELIQSTLQPFEAISEYYARHMSFHKESYEFAAFLRDQRNEIVSNSDISSLFRLIGDQIFGEGNQFPPDPFQAIAVAEHAINQYALIQELALENDSLKQAGALDQSVEAFRDVIYEIVNAPFNLQSRNGTYANLVNMAGLQSLGLWGSVLAYSYIPYFIWSRDEYAYLLSEHDEFIRQSLNAANNSFIRNMGRMYAILSQMVEEHVSLYDAYIDWAAAQLTVEERNELLDERRKWADLLKPASIHSIETQSNIFERTNHLLVSWQTSHPTGRTGQNIVRMIPERGLRPPILLSTGNGTEFSRYLFPDDISKNNATYHFEFAVRSPAGTIVSFKTDPVTFSMGDGQSYESEGIRPGPVVNPSVEPPRSPRLELPLFDFEGNSFIAVNEFIPFTILQNVEIQTPLQYQYAIRTTDSSEGDWVVDWTSFEAASEMPNGIPINGYWADLLGVDDATWAQFSVAMDGQESFQTFQGYFSGSILEHEKSYEFFVRAENAFGMQSEPASMIFHVDKTPPVFGGDFAEVNVQPSEIRSDEYIQIVGFDSVRPERLQPSIDFEPFQPEPHMKEVEVTWPEATDPETGIHEYQIAISSEENPSAAFNSEESFIFSADHLSTELTQQAAFYNQPWFVHVRAQNSARSSSYLSSDEQQPMVDVIRPFPGIVRPGQYNGQPVLWEILPPSDVETPILGYQYAIGYIPFTEQGIEGDLVLMRPFPEGASTDFTVSQYDIPASGISAPGFLLNNLDWELIETYHRRFILVRSVNNQGLTSDILVMNLDGMAFEDVTPPVAGEIIYQYHTNFVNFNAHFGEWVDITVDGLHDEGSGIESIRLVLTDAATGEVVYDEITEYDPRNYRVPRTEENQSYYSSPSVRVRLPGEGIRLGGRKFNIELTAVNGAGLYTVQSGEMDLFFPPIEPFGISAFVQFQNHPDGHLLGVNVRGIRPGQTGFSDAEFMVENYDTGELLLPWTSYSDDPAVVPNFQDPLSLFFIARNNAFWAIKLRITVRVYDGSGQSTTVSISYGRSPAS